MVSLSNHERTRRDAVETALADEVEELAASGCVFEMEGIAGPQARLADLAILGRNVGPKQLRLTGLFEDYLAAP